MSNEAASKQIFQSQVKNPDLPQVWDISVDEVNEKQHQLTLIDVRRPDEYVGELGHIKSAQLLTLDHLPMMIGDLKKDSDIVFVCRSGARSARAAAFALENGFSRVYNMKGGMIEWNEKGYTIETEHSED